MTEEKKAELRAALSKEVTIKLDSTTVLQDLDSLDIMSLCVAIEKVAGVEVAYGEISQCDTYAQLEELVSERASK